MKFPIKLNRLYWGKVLTHIFPSSVDPRVLCSGKIDAVSFTSAVSVLKFGTTLKTTNKKRFTQTIQELANLKFQGLPVVLDVGASDGSASIDVIRNIEFNKYYLTDLNIEIFYNISGGATYFYDEKGVNILMVSDKWVVYFDADGAIFPFNKILNLIKRRIPKLVGGNKKIVLINPELQALVSSKVAICKYNMFEAWNHEKVDLIVAGNILNQCYFSDFEILNVLKNLISALKENGRIVIVDNRPHEKSSIFKFVKGVVKLEKRINGGTDIESLVLNNDTWE